MNLMLDTKGSLAARLRATVELPSNNSGGQDRSNDLDAKKLSPLAQFKKSRQLHQQQNDEIRRQRFAPFSRTTFFVSTNQYFLNLT